MKTSHIQGGSQSGTIHGEISAAAGAEKTAAYAAKGKPGGRFAAWRESKARQVAIYEAVAAGRMGACAHFLTDYRNGNTVIARKPMDLKTAFIYNKRLEGTGFAWARKSAAP